MIICHLTTLLLLCVPCYGLRNAENSYNIIEMVITSLERIVSYYKHTYMKMNMDGIFGLKVAEGQFRFILRSKNRFKIPLMYFKRIQNMYIQTVNLSSQAVPYLKQDDEEYYKRTRMLLKPWEIWLGSREIDEKLVWEAHRFDHGFVLNETVSDHCLGELMEKPGLCSVSLECINVMLRQRGTRGYTTTHQVLYIHVIHMVNCVAAINHQMSKIASPEWTLTFWENELCANILASITETLVAEMGIVSQQDLFMEEVFVCGVLGFPIFMRPSFARKIVSWQHPDGCFGAHLNPATTRAPPNTKVGLRKLLEEKNLADGCLAHKTAVALGTLSALLHSFTENDELVNEYQQLQVRNSRPKKRFAESGKVIDLENFVPYQRLTKSDMKSIKYNHIQWAFPLITVVLTLVLFWEIRAFKLCSRKTSQHL